MNVINLDTWASYGRAFNESLQAILAGEIIVYPTDTVYRIGVNATDADAVRKIKVAKGDDEPISILVSDFQMLRRYCQTEGIPFALLQQLFPGPISGIFHKIGELPDEITTGEKIEICIPHHQFALSLVRKLDFPITSATANLTGELSPKTVADVPDELKAIARVVVDGGRCLHADDPTVVDFTTDMPHVVRDGADSERVCRTIDEFYSP